MTEFGIESSVLDDILEGRKHIEGRLARDKFLKLKVGDHITIREDIYDGPEIIGSIPYRAEIIVTKLQRFSSFEELLRVYSFKELLPSTRTLEEALQTYRQFYSKEDEAKHGVIAITFVVSE